MKHKLGFLIMAVLSTFSNADSLMTEGYVGSINDNDVNLTQHNVAGGASEAMDNIFGADDRKAITSTQYPWRTVGYLNSGCTGTLVGRDLVLTAAHCVVTKESKILPSLTAFYPNYINGKSADSAGISYVWWGTNDPDKFRKADWAIIRLNKPLGDKYGWMGTTVRPDVDRVTLAGYSGDFLSGKTAGAHIGCYIRERVGTLVYHDCDDTRGASGGPMFDMFNNQPLIVSINVAEFRKGGEVSLKLPKYSKEYANIGVPTATFLPKLKEILGVK